MNFDVYQGAKMWKWPRCEKPRSLSNLSYPSSHRISKGNAKKLWDSTSPGTIHFSNQFLYEDLQSNSLNFIFISPLKIVKKHFVSYLLKSPSRKSILEYQISNKRHSVAKLQNDAWRTKSRVASYGDSIRSSLFFLSTSRWIRSLVSPFVTIRVRYGRQYLNKSVFGWMRRTGMGDFWQ